MISLQFLEETLAEDADLRLISSSVIDETWGADELSQKKGKSLQSTGIQAKEGASCSGEPQHLKLKYSQFTCYVNEGYFLKIKESLF